MRRLALVLFITLMIASSAFIVGTVGQLPPRVASHFGGAGQVNAWMTRDGYLLFTLGFATLLYWLAPPRRSETLVTLGAFGGWLGSLLTVFIAALHYTILEANTSVPPQLPAPLLWSVLGGFVAAILSWQALFYLRFRNAPPT